MPATSFGLSIFLAVCVYMIIMGCVASSIGTPKEDPNLIKTVQGHTSKIEFQGHTYVVWSVNMGGGIVHDPDCICNNKKE